MKKTCFLLLAIAMASLTTAQVKPITLPGKGHINAERLNGNIDMNMDISQLSVCELRALRNAFAARQGYLFKSSELRMLFNTTSWYDSLAWERELADNPKPVTYTKQQSAFMEKLLAREKELLKNNLKAGQGRVNLDNLINPFQLEVFPEELRSHLERDGFAIVEADHEQLAADALADACYPGNPREADHETVKELFRKIMA